MSNLALNFNTANFYGKDYLNPQTNFSVNTSYGNLGMSSQSLFSFEPSFSTLPAFGGYSGFGSFDSLPAESMFMGSVATNKPSFDSNNYFGIMPAMSELKFPEPKFNYTANPFKARPAINKDGSRDYRITSLNTQTSLSELSGFYNPEKGLKLAQTTANRIENSFTGNCATYVKKAIVNSGLGKYEFGDAYKTADILRRNKNFKEVKVSPYDFSKLPAGCVIVYNKGAANYSSKYGHIEVTLGNNKAASDFITNNIRPSKNATVFVPV